MISIRDEVTFVFLFKLLFYMYFIIVGGINVMNGTVIYICSLSVLNL